MGVKSHKLTDKTGKVAAVKVVDPTNDVLVISDDGTIIRMAAESISVYSRSTQGVRMMRLQEGSKVISIEKVDQEDSDESAEAIPAEEATEE